MGDRQSGSTNDQTFGDWIGLAREGSPEALGKLLEGCRQYLLLVANAELPDELQPKLGASDVVQETFLEAQRDFLQFQGCSEHDVLAWLRRILLNNIRDATRRYAGTAKRELSREVGFAVDAGTPGGAASQTLTTHVTPSWLARSRETNESLRRALERLSEDHRQVIVLRNLELLSFVQIAELMRRSPDAVRKLWSRAIDALQQELGEDLSS